MQTTPRWYMPVAITALLWNLLGCAAFLADMSVSAEDLAKLSDAQQALYAARPAWAVAATATAVFAGTLGCLALILRKRWAVPLLIASLIGVLVQDYGLFMLIDGASLAGPVAVVMQSLVLLISISLVLLAMTASKRRWIR